jgi:alpha-maltose-1-phosphate synthase
MRTLFVNENIGGHATVHLHLEQIMAARPEIQPQFLHVPAPGLGRRVVGASLPFLGRLDLDLQPLRAQLALSAVVRSALRRRLPDVDAVYLYTHNAGLLSSDLLRSRPTVVALDTTNAANAYRLPYRLPTRWTPRVLPLTQAFERRVYAAATLVVACSEWAAASLRTSYGLADSRLRVIPFGIRVPSFDRPPAFHGRSDLPKIVFVGRQMLRKGGWRLLDLHQRHLRDRCELVLVTTDPVPATPGVTVIGDLRPGDPRLWDVLRSSTAFVFPSLIDQAPNSVLEAMAAGLPVVAMRVAALPEMVVDGETGRLVDPDDAQGLLDAITALLDDPAAAARMGAAGRARVLRRYDAEATADSLLAVLKEATNLHGGTG